ncbi:hypothetical protein SELMODRAFT_114853 [Selaginella moellendorffii]|uniref:Uncharacterized protein n=1 Tax=Selaginella moellendorffii TaxID=88036 RepID=D8SDW6_SELML|nr:hypothetical protein SELMODRAFT_114853 [Selaginella moellendorffii]
MCPRLATFLALLLPAFVRSGFTAEVPALFAFGDSLADVGNNNYLVTLAKANFPPYGREFDTGKPTGRFTNGRNQIDFLAARLGLPLLPAFMDPSTKGLAMLSGVNFASAGSGILDITNINFVQGQLIQITEQVQNFAKVKEELVSMVGSANATEMLSRSLFCIFTGNNDYTMTYPLTGAVSNLRFQNTLLSKLLEQTRELYNLGARKFVIAGVGAMGCVPAQLARYGRSSCVHFLNNPVMKYNRALHRALTALNHELPEAHIVYSDLYYQMMSIVQDPAPFGIKNVNDACCGVFKQIQSCVPGVPVCNDASEYYFWDAYHPSSRTCEFLVEMLYDKGPPYNFPFSVETLVRI